MRAAFERMLAEKPSRNRDNVARTESYLELYLLARKAGRELPWIFMAHLVSRHAGYMMTDLGALLEDPKNIFTREATLELFVFLERANFLIFEDAWHHLLHHLLDRTGALGDETPRFVREAWRRFEHASHTGISAAIERRLVLDLVTNEQNIIERRVVHNPRYERARAMVAFFEATRADAPIQLPISDAAIRVGGFARLERRIETGRRIFDEALADAARREAMLAWARAHPHTGSRGVYTKARHPLTLREAWPVHRVRAIAPHVHAPMEDDPGWP